MSLGRVGVAIGVASMVAVGASLVARRHQEISSRLVTGKYISPVGDQVEVGSYPVNIKLSPDGRFLMPKPDGLLAKRTLLLRGDRLTDSILA